MGGWLVFLIILVVLELYSFYAVRTAFKSYRIALIFEIVSLATIAFVLYAFLNFDRSIGQNRLSMAGLGCFLLLLLPKLLITFLLVLEDSIRVMVAGYKSVSRQGITPSKLPGRRRFISITALSLAAVPFLGLLHGIFVGKYNFRVIRKSLFFEDLPEAFDGFTITQFSDLHSGSFDDPEKIAYAVNLINDTKPDLLLFTGDIVNSKAAEMHPWIAVFSELVTPAFGKFSILGNHDYGEYLIWNSDREKEENFNAIKDLHNRIGFDLILNEHRVIAKGKHTIKLIGVENWGRGFKKAGDLKKASSGIKKEDFKILMSHDPSHWDSEVKDHPLHFHLTLSGHTHGLQFGIEIPGWLKWSPVQYVYKYWAGLYEVAGRYLYVNRGFGFHAYPGRVGIWPEITVLELKKHRNNA